MSSHQHVCNFPQSLPLLELKEEVRAWSYTTLSQREEMKKVSTL